MSEIDNAVARIDERTKLILEQQADLVAHMKHLDQAVFTGNGSKPLLERVGTLEASLGNYVTQCEQCRQTILAPKSDDSLAELLIKQQSDVKRTENDIKKVEAETKQVTVTKRWEFWIALISGSGLFVSLLNSAALVAQSKP